LAFQVIDDLLDFEGTSESLGKPAGVDLTLGLATAPVLYAKEQYPEISAMIQRNFKAEGDVEKTVTLVKNGNSLQRTKELAKSFIQDAIAALAPLHPSSAKDALIELAKLVPSRKQ